MTLPWLGLLLLLLLLVLPNHAHAHAHATPHHAHAAAAAATTTLSLPLPLSTMTTTTTTTTTPFRAVDDAAFAFAPTSTPALRASPSSATTGATQWAKLDHVKPTTVESMSMAVTHVHFVPGAAAVTSGARVQLYSVNDLDREDGVQRTRGINKFTGTAHSARLRNDAKLLCGGNENGTVLVIDTESKGILRTCVGHAAAPRVVRWAKDGVHIASGAGDKTARLWDLKTGETVAVFKPHTDDVRALAQVAEAVWATGAYDSQIRLFDAREKSTSSATATSDHGDPVEDLVFLDDGAAQGATLISAGGSVVCSWDPRAMRLPLARARHHQKTVSCLVPSADERFVLSGSLDGTVKVMDAANVETAVHTLRFRGAILTLGVSSDDWRVAAGMADGEFVVRTRRGGPPSRAPPSEAAAVVESHPLRTGSAKYFVRGANAKPDEDADVVVGVGVGVGTARMSSTTSGKPTQPGPKRLRPHDALLKQFSYREALDAALETREPNAVAAVLEELSQRGEPALRAALHGRDEAELEPVLAFVTRFVAHPRFAPVLVPVCEAVLDAYDVGASAGVDALVGKLDQQVKAEVAVQEELQRTMGEVEMVLRGRV